MKYTRKYCMTCIYMLTCSDWRISGLVVQNFGVILLAFIVCVWIRGWYFLLLLLIEVFNGFPIFICVCWITFIFVLKSTFRNRICPLINTIDSKKHRTLHLYHSFVLFWFTDIFYCTRTLNFIFIFVSVAMAESTQQRKRTGQEGQQCYSYTTLKPYFIIHFPPILSLCVFTSSLIVIHSVPTKP